MAHLFLQVSVSLDGYIEDGRGDIAWMVDDSSLDAVATATLREIGGMVFGRKAHTLLARFWPTAAARPGASPELIEQARLMMRLPKYVLTRGEERTGWANSHAVSLDDLTALKRHAARPIAVFAGAGAAQALLGHGLLDEIRLIQYPLLLGNGTRLFPDDGVRRSLLLEGLQFFASGATLQRYRVQ
jgi:dihydrofolate reductase